MQPILRAIIILLSASVFLITLELIRRGKLREEHSLIWLLSSALIFIFATFRGSGRFLAQVLQIEYTPALFFMLGIGLLIIIQMLHSTTLSRLTGHNRDLAQELAILELRLADFADRMVVMNSARIGDLPSEILEALKRRLDRVTTQEALIRTALDVTLEHVPASGGSMLILNDEDDLIDAAVSNPHASGPADLSEFGQTVQHGLAGWVIQNRRGALVSDTSDDPRWLKRPWDLRAGGNRSAICAPVVIDDRVAAVMTLVGPGGTFTEADLAFLMAMTYLIAKPYRQLAQPSSQAISAEGAVPGEVAEQPDEPVLQDQAFGE
jgi:hypothetical protein